MSWYAASASVPWRGAIHHIVSGYMHDCFLVNTYHAWEVVLRAGRSSITRRIGVMKRVRIGFGQGSKVGAMFVLRLADEVLRVDVLFHIKKEV
jgi:hypothetical protein